MSLRRKNTVVKQESDLAFNQLLSHPYDLTTAIEKRFEGWKQVVKAYINYYKEIADGHQDYSKKLSRAVNNLNTTDRVGETFMPESEPGITYMNNLLKNRTNEQVSSVETSMKDIENFSIKELIKLKVVIKEQTKTFHNEFNKLNQKVIKHRNAIKTHYEALSNAFETNNQKLNVEDDPWLINFSLNKQLANNNEEETEYIKNLTAQLNSIKQFEDNIMQNIKNVITQQTDSFNSHYNKEGSGLKSLVDSLGSVSKSSEWDYFIKNNQNYDIRNAPNTTKTVEDLQHAKNKDDYLKIIKEGNLLSQHGFAMFKSFKEFYFVLTNTGFLHAFSSSDYLSCKEPEFSINLSLCVLGSLNNENEPKNSFEITQKKEGLFKGEHKYLVKTLDANFENAKQWWECISQKSSAVLNTPDQINQSANISSSVQPPDLSNINNNNNNNTTINPIVNTSAPAEMQTQNEKVLEETHLHDKSAPEIHSTQPQQQQQPTLEMPPNPQEKNNEMSNELSEDSTTHKQSTTEQPLIKQQVPQQ